MANCEFVLAVKVLRKMPTSQGMIILFNGEFFWQIVFLINPNPIYKSAQNWSKKIPSVRDLSLCFNGATSLTNCEFVKNRKLQVRHKMPSNRGMITLFKRRLFLANCDVARNPDP